MTRFARVQGSKHSNERQPEEATSWQVMKQQLQEGLHPGNKQSAVENQKDKKALIRSVKKGQSGNWAEIDIEENEKVIRKRKNIQDPTDDMNRRKKKKNTLELKGKTENGDDNTTVRKKEKSLELTQENVEEKVNRKKRKTVELTEEDNTTDKKEKKSLELIVENVGEEKVRRKEKNAAKLIEEDQKQNNGQRSEETLAREKGKRCFQCKRKGHVSRQCPNKHKRLPSKETSTQSKTIFVNKAGVEVVKFDGFPVMKADADRLNELRQKLYKKKIPSNKIIATIKFERRKSEKALARINNKMCFKCRKSGHVLSECPEIEESYDCAVGTCFKCGSTEHTHTECKVVRGQDYRFAECFICKDKGHIAKQCPNNPRGLYPKGGGCKICGDVTHLKKDCPDLIVEKQDATITLETLDTNSLEVLDEDIKRTKKMAVVQKSPKTKKVKF